MSKKLRELLQALETEKAKVRSLLAENKVLDAEKVMEEVRSLQKAVALQQELEALEAVSYTHLDVYKRQEQYHSSHVHFFANIANGIIRAMLPDV